MAGKGLADIFNTLKREESKPAADSRKRRSSVEDSPLGEEQRSVFELIERSNRSLFITGKAGTGKSFLLEYFAGNSSKNVVVVAPTGVAAIKVGGQTIHSFFRIPPHHPINEDGLEPFGNRKEVLRNLDVVVIDEVSMVNSDLMEAIDVVLRRANESDLPFGGKQMVLFGDLYQLPPVTQPQVKRYLDDRYGGSLFFYSPAVRRLDLEVVELQHVFRQKDPRFVELLSQVREGRLTQAGLDALNERASCEPQEDPAVLIAPTNDTVAKINSAMLDQIDEDEFVYQAEVEGDFSESEFPVQKQLRLKVGARVMMLKNDLNTASQRPGEKARWVNGTLGVVTKLTTDQVWVMINGVSHQIDKNTWWKSQYSYDPRTKTLRRRLTASFSQFPIALAWAVTVHKAQGATYQSVAIDLADGMFAPGQAYVALSRCVSLDKLYLTRRLDQADVMVSQEAKAFMSQHMGAVPSPGLQRDDGGKRGL